jgi:VanZ family protein
MSIPKKFYLLSAILWLTVITILLIIPGSAFPSENWMSRISLDKWVHIFLFALLVILWTKGLWKNYIFRVSYRKLIIYIGLIAIVYGIVMEIIQHYFIPNRSFELNDIFADAAGALVGCLYLLRSVIKK